jgi:hypothetical protein
VVQTDANANSDKSIIKPNNFDLFLALHSDADAANDQGGGMIGSGDKSVDVSWKRSAEIAGIMKGVYFKEAGIVDKNYVTAGMTKYYMWKYLSYNTPCVLLEMGQTQDPHDKVLLANTVLIASSIVRSICKVFNVLYDLPTNTVDPKDEKIVRLESELSKAQASLVQAESQFRLAMAEKDKDCQGIKDRLKQISVLSTL